MKKYNLSNIMKRAWELAKNMGETMEEKLIRLGYKVWEKGDMKRIYINDFQKYLEVEETNTPAAMGRGRIINGICTDEYKSFAQRQALNLVDWGFGAKLYYDCKKEDWFCKNPGGSLIKKILWTVVDKLDCENCPENRGDFPHDRLPCGQQNCWVTCHCKEM